MLEVIEAGGLISVQDLGRTGWRRFGVPLAGPMDEFAFRAANLLVGNPPQEAALEVGAGDLTLRGLQDCVIAVAGRGFDVQINVWRYPLWGAYFVRAGWTIQLSRTESGMWAYVSVGGGIEAASVLGSRSTYLPGHFGGVQGRTLQPGDTLRAARNPHLMMEAAGRTFANETRPSYGGSPTVEVVLGPHVGQFAGESLDTFFASAYRVSVASDRMGYRLEGPRLQERVGGHLAASMVSQGLTPGVIQVPADGEPIVMMADSATTGGYPMIACVIRADLPVLSQCTPGKDEVRFRQTSVEAAERKYRMLMRGLHDGLVGAQDS